MSTRLIFFCYRSADGTTYQLDQERPAFGIADDFARFDWKFVSTPCVIQRGAELYLYYTASNFDGEFNCFEGRSEGELRGQALF